MSRRAVVPEGRTWLPWVAVACLGGAASLGCDAQGEGPPKATAASPDDLFSEGYRGPALPRGRVVLEDAFGGRHAVEVEIAADGASRSRGLMWRRSLAEGAGMLFIFPEERIQSFYMRNTLIPLDMVFIGRDSKVAGVVARAEPKTLTSRGVGKPSLYVLEVPGGWAEKISLKPQSIVEMQGVDGVAVKP
ncbi:MAG TPA: DUF192 domain-containing protein [Myxococcaceae bacterium]|nr:DUF192 domain-containing protein [Myxococcaceae bacterium]